jgi:4-hydroxy-4-methyl-2-oxoglutarate aldolase
MIENPPLLTLRRGWRRPDPALVTRFRGPQTSQLVDAMEGRGALDRRVKLMGAKRRMDPL